MLDLFNGDLHFGISRVLLYRVRKMRAYGGPKFYSGTEYNM